MPALNGLKRLKWRLVRDAKIALGYARRRSIDDGPFTIDLSSQMGMGALIARALAMHAWVADSGRDAAIVSTNPLYSSGEDVLAAFFERPAPRGPVLDNLVQEWIGWRQAPQHLSLDRAHALMAQHFRPNAVLRDALDRACGGNDRFDLAIHFRGTDKHRESGVVESAQMMRALDPHLVHATRAFLATDDPQFARELRAAWPGVEFLSYDLGEVPDGTPRHFSTLAAHDKALEALVNIYLIALAPLCVRTSSYLSAISRLVNPAMKTETINRTQTGYQPFPEAEILETEGMAPA